MLGLGDTFQYAVSLFVCGDMFYCVIMCFSSTFLSCCDSFPPPRLSLVPKPQVRDNSSESENQKCLIFNVQSFSPKVVGVGEGDCEQQQCSVFRKSRRIREKISVCVLTCLHAYISGRCTILQEHRIHSHSQEGEEAAGESKSKVNGGFQRNGDLACW